MEFVFVYDINVNKELLKQGLAWHYKQYNKDEELAKLEKEARKKIIGLWSHPNPVALGILEENKNLLEFFVLTNYYFTGG